MKRVLSLLLILAMSFGLLACQEVNPTATTPAAESTETVTDVPASPDSSDTEENTETGAPVSTDGVVTDDSAALDSVTLKERYADTFMIGCALPLDLMKNPISSGLFLEQFNSITMENEMKPDAMLNQTACIKALPASYTEPVLSLSKLDSILSFAQENGIKMRGHTLVWHSQTPKWFFTEDYTANGALVSKEVMLQRMESYIRQMITYCEDNYPGVVYAWDVVNEAVDPDAGNDPNGYRTVDSMWYKVVGPDFIEAAFTYARKYAAEGVHLYYNDYNCSLKVPQLKALLTKLHDKGLIDGMGMQCHLSTSDKIANAVYYTAVSLAETGVMISITELDIGVGESSSLETQAMKYKVLFERMEEAQKSGKLQIESITVWGLYDQRSWRPGEQALLFTKTENGLEKKAAWYGAMQASDILAIEW